MLRSIVGLALSVLVSSLSAGCAPVGPNYKRPEMQSPSAYRFVQEPEQAQSLADLPWWEVFDDVALQNLVWEAVSNNLDVRIAGRNLKTWTKYSGLDPETSLGGSINRVTGVDYFNLPQTRSIVLTVGLNR